MLKVQITHPSQFKLELNILPYISYFNMPIAALVDEKWYPRIRSGIRTELGKHSEVSEEEISEALEILDCVVAIIPVELRTLAKEETKMPKEEKKKGLFGR
jgi:hypothetical protein